ncbi:MAG: hypothetical protein ACP5SI_01195 [Chloroflexia bacterium]
MNEAKGTKGSQKHPGGIGERLSEGGVPSGPAAPQPVEGSAAERVADLQRRLNQVRSRAALTDLRGSLARLDALVSALPAAVAEIRRLGYVYRAGLEQETEGLGSRWQELSRKVEAEASSQGQLLLQQADALLRRLSALPARPEPAQLDTLEREIKSLEERVESACAGIEQLYAATEQELQRTDRLLKHLRWMLEQAASAAFHLRPEENLVEAVEAQYLTEGEREGPEGILYLTDQRLLFEQKEDVTRKKFLFIPTEKERVQRLLLEAPIGAVQQSQAHERGALLWKKEWLELAFSSQAPVSRARFVLKGDSEAYQALIGRIQSGDIAAERVGGVPVEQPAPQLPTRCPACGAALTTEIVRGMRSVTCGYCGTVIPL